MESSKISLPQRQYHLFHDPSSGLSRDVKTIYRGGTTLVGWPPGAKKLFAKTARPNTVAFAGVGLGDEGKGRFVDNKLEEMLADKHVSRVYVIRYQGGSNAGHTVEKGKLRLALHQVPSGVLYEKAIGLMDRGMVIHPEDLNTEVAYVEHALGDMRGKLYLSEDAIIVTDLERAEELLNRVRQGKAAGGTGRGIGPAYAHHYDRLGLRIVDLMAPAWRETFAAQYDRYRKEFAVYDMPLADSIVPDYANTLKSKREEKRRVGSQTEFLDRLEEVRRWLIRRDMVCNLYPLHREVYGDTKSGVLFEGAQALGLHPWLGTWPDVTASDTSVYGIHGGTGYWRLHDVANRIGVFKLTYTSSVGARHMPTEVALPKDLAELPATASADEQWAAYIRKEAHEYGTTTGRPRDILKLDLPMLSYNCRMSGIESLAGTHLDMARENEAIKVCTHYTDTNGKPVPYQPGLRYIEGVVPHYIELPGWDGMATRQAKTQKTLPENARKFLIFLERRTGYPIVAVTTGPARENLVTFPGYA